MTRRKQVRVRKWMMLPRKGCQSIPVEQRCGWCAFCRSEGGEP
jgi:hypothetical protein